MDFPVLFADNTRCSLIHDSALVLIIYLARVAGFSVPPGTFVSRVFEFN